MAKFNGKEGYATYAIKIARENQVAHFKMSLVRAEQVLLSRIKIYYCPSINPSL